MISKYINYNQIVEEMIRKREDNLFALTSLLEQRAELEAQDGVRSVQYDKAPSRSGPKDDGIVNIAIQRQLADERIHNLQVERRLLDRAWAKLTSEERQVLEIFYQQNLTRQQALDLLCDQFHCERTKAYAMRLKSIQRLKGLLFG